MPPSGDRVGDRVDQRLVALRRDAKHRREGRGHGARVTDPGQLDRSTRRRRNSPGQLGTHLDALSLSLANATDAAQRDQPVGPHASSAIIGRPRSSRPTRELSWCGRFPAKWSDAAEHGELRRGVRRR